MRSLTWAELQEFERDLLFKQLANPDYRYGQALLNYFPWIYKNLQDNDIRQGVVMTIWQSNDRNEVIDLVGLVTWVDDE